MCVKNCTISIVCLSVHTIVCPVIGRVQAPDLGVTAQVIGSSGPSAVVRENLSPFTKDFRAEGRTMSVRSFFGIPSKERDTNP